MLEAENTAVRYPISGGPRASSDVAFQRLLQCWKQRRQHKWAMAEWAMAGVSKQQSDPFLLPDGHCISVRRDLQTAPPDEAVPPEFATALQNMPTVVKPPRSQSKHWR